MSFPNYSSLFTLGLSSSSAGSSKPAPAPAAPTKKPTTGRRRSRAHSLKSFLKLDTRAEPAPPMPALPIVTPHTPVSSTHSSPKSPPAPLMCRRSRETLRSIPSPKPIPSSQTLPEPPSLGLPMPMLSPSASPASAISTLPPSTPPPPATLRPISESTIDTASLSVRPPVAARKSSTALGLGIGLGLTEVKPKAHANRMSVAASSVASPRRRRVQRSAALANLEGRSSAENARAAPFMRNFMSMSDDEDDEAPQPSSAPVSPTIPLDVSSKSHRSRALSDVSSVVLRADFLDFGLSPTSTMISSSVLHGDTAEDGFRALDAALFAALGSGGSKSQTFSSFIDVST